MCGLHCACPCAYLSVSVSVSVLLTVINYCLSLLSVLLPLCPPSSLSSLQVDVIDAEYEHLCGEIQSNRHSSHSNSQTSTGAGAGAGDGAGAGADTPRSTQNFKSVLQAHKHYLSAVIRLSMVDNAVVQEAIGRVLHCCMRLVALFQWLAEEREGLGGSDRPDTGTNSSSGIPLAEVEALKREFFSQMWHLLQLMRKLEHRGFLFRIDFNGFMSEMGAPGNNNN